MVRNGWVSHCLCDLHGLIPPWWSQTVLVLNMQNPDPQKKTCLFTVGDTNNAQKSYVVNTWRYTVLKARPSGCLRWPKKGSFHLLGGPPDPVISRVEVIYSIYRGSNPSYPFVRLSMGYKYRTPFITSRGPPCVNKIEFNLSAPL